MDSYLLKCNAFPAAHQVAKGKNGGTEEEDYVADWESNVAYRIKQRYALATLYYALHIEEGNMIHHGWLGSVVDECEFVEGKNGQQRQAWEGVGCDDEGNVRVLMLGKFKFSFIYALYLSCFLYCKLRQTDYSNISTNYTDNV